MTAEPPLQLTKSRREVEGILDRHREDGRKLADAARAVSTSDEYQGWKETWERWVSLTAEGLKASYSSDEPAEEFRNKSRTPIIVGGAGTSRRFEWEKEAVGRGVNTLDSLRERLEYVEAPGDAAPDPAPERTSPGEAQVFLVHGHAEDVKEGVCRLLEKTGEHPILILHEQPSGGRTLIEKFEDHAGASDLAVVLLTGDDVGGKATADGSQPMVSKRARQNVVFELGFFVGRLGRSRVVVLFEEGVEPPSDFKGVVYISLADDSWRYKLLQELRSAGLAFDLNKLPT